MPELPEVETVCRGLSRALAGHRIEAVTLHRKDGKTEVIKALCRIDTLDEIEYFRNGGILHYVLRMIARTAKKAA